MIKRGSIENVLIFGGLVTIASGVFWSLGIRSGVQIKLSETHQGSAAIDIV